MGENGPCSDRWGMLSKSLIQFSVGGRGRVPSLLFDLRPNHGGGKKIMASFKRSHASTAAFSVPTLQQATADPHLCQRLLDTHRQVWVSLLWGPCSFLLGPGAHNVLSVPSKSLFPQSWVSSVIRSHWPPKSNSLGVLSPFARSPGWEICCGS